LKLDDGLETILYLTTVPSVQRKTQSVHSYVEVMCMNNASFLLPSRYRTPGLAAKQ